MSSTVSAESPERASDDAALVAADALSAWQWEAHLAGAAALPVWNARALGYRQWTRELWAAEGLEADRAGLLTARQSDALWRRVIAESREGQSLLSVAATASWAEDAWRRVNGWQLDAALRRAADHEHDYAAFLRWRRRYAERLQDGRWIDGALLDAQLTQAAATFRRSSIELADLDDHAPSTRALLERLSESGWRVTRRRSPSATAASACRLECVDPDDELRSAAAWARQRLERDPDARLALVVPDLERRAPEVHRALADELTDFDDRHGIDPVPIYAAADDDGRPEHSQPLIGAAVNALDMMSPHGSLPDFGRWLRSPAFHGDGWSALAALARVDAAVRSDVAAQIPFVDAYRRSGLRNRVRSEAPEAAARLDAALLEIDAGPAGRTPAGWVQLWSRLLQCLGWRGWRAAGAADAGAADQRHWEAALRDFAMLTPIVGAVPEARALAELDASLRRTRPANPVPLRGVHVLRSIAAIGPGYAGAWIAGATDSELPAPARLNPLLPRHVQVDAGMPWSSPQDALRRSRELVAEAVRRVPECVFSWPARDGEQEHEPSPLIDGFAAADAPPRERRSARARAPGAAELECVSDAAPPLESAEIRGGTAALNAQSLSPLRAFCEFRLAAKPLEPFARGVPARVRGIATHAALERFFRVYDSRRRLAAASAGERRLRAARCAQEALAGLFGAARGPLTALFELERDRLAMMIERLADKELERSDYRVEELEQKRSLEVRGRVLRLRIDRIDALEDDGIAVIDYKTGRGIPASSWLSPRPRDVQLPTYALVLPNSAALVVASLRAGDVRYAGIWPKGAFPGQSRGNGESIEQLLETWRHTVGALVDEYCGGDTRFFAGDPEPIGGVYAPLTRLYEQLALHRAREARERP